MERLEPSEAVKTMMDDLLASAGAGDGAAMIRAVEILLGLAQRLYKAGKMPEEERFRVVAFAVETINEKRADNGYYDAALGTLPRAAGPALKDQALRLLLAQTYREYGEPEIAALIEASPGAYRDRMMRTFGRGRRSS